MEIKYLKSNDILKLKEKIVCTIGVFDGIHIAHALIFKEVLKQAKLKKLKSAVFTFNPHPDYILSKRKDVGYLMPIEERLKYFESYGFDYCFVLVCDLAMLNLSYQEFNSHFLTSIEEIIVGEDFNYGYKALGKPANLKEVGATVKVVKEVKLENHKLGSEDIRLYLASGEIDKANKILDKPFKIEGVVTKGNEIGRTMGLATANIALKADYLLIKDGVYSADVIIDKRKYQSICNIGSNPTLERNIDKRLEAHIFDFNGDLYGKEITIYIKRFIREEKKFANLLELQEQIAKDIKKCLEIK